MDPETSSPFALVWYGWLLAAVMMALLWIVQRNKHDAGVVDVGWSAGIGILAIFYALSADGYLPRRALVGVMAGLWSFRLASYIFLDRVVGRKSEDGRYQELRQQWGARAQPYFLIFFQAQGLLVALFSLPLLVLVCNPQPAFSGWEIAGVVLWLVSIAGESVADRQLARFRAKPEHRGKTCRVGLWHYSRHPNYFFEWLHWWSYVLMAVGVAYGWLTLIGPALLLYLLFKVTGIPPTEAQALASRGDDYRAYQRSTSVFIPWFPAKDSERRSASET